jgi:hypothetical protein
MEPNVDCARMGPASAETSKPRKNNVQASRLGKHGEQERFFIYSPFEQTSEKNISFAAFVNLKLDSM